MNRRTKVAVLDANVLFHAGLRDLLLTFAESQLFSPIWTRTIQSELAMALFKKRPTILKEKVFHLLNVMDDYFDESEVMLDASDFSNLSLPDPNDLHVLAAAIKSGASHIVTFNLRDFPNNILKRYGVAAVHPDVFCESIIVKNRSVAAEAFAAQINALKSPALNREQVLDGLSKVGMKKTVALLR